jgi:hypothetical protein
MVMVPKICCCSVPPEFTRVAKSPAVKSFAIEVPAVVPRVLAKAVIADPSVL